MSKPDFNEILKYYPEISGIHPAAEMFPLPNDDDYQTLVIDVEKNGLMQPLIIDKDGLLIDGRSRLMAIYDTHNELRFEVYDGAMSQWDKSLALNLARRNLTAGQKAFSALHFLEHEEELAAKRQAEAGGDHGNQYTGGKSAACDRAITSGNPQNGKARDRVGIRFGVGGASVGRAKTIRTHAPELEAKVNRKEISLEDAAKKAMAKKRKKEQRKERRNADKTPIVTVDGEVADIPLPKVVKFNKTNYNVDWASWTWNPVTGCNHGCEFCYAREIAVSSTMKPFYPFGFTPAFREYSLNAPINTTVPNSLDERDGRVFVCSMADLFGKWVPDEWINAVFDACLKAPEWEYLFLTKWPKRYSKMPLLKRAWYGASIIKQADVNRVERDMSAFQTDGCVKWISLEPLLEPIIFNDISWCDLMVIGGQTETRQPHKGKVEEFAPELDWIVDIIIQCREAGVPYYIKPNVGLERPGMALPKMMPRNFNRRQ